MQRKASKVHEKTCCSVFAGLRRIQVANYALIRYGMAAVCRRCANGEGQLGGPLKRNTETGLKSQVMLLPRMRFGDPSEWLRAPEIISLFHFLLTPALFGFSVAG